MHIAIHINILILPSDHADQINGSDGTTATIATAATTASTSPLLPLLLRRSCRSLLRLLDHVALQPRVQRGRHAAVQEGALVVVLYVVHRPLRVNHADDAVVLGELGRWNDGRKGGKGGEIGEVRGDWKGNKGKSGRVEA